MIQEADNSVIQKTLEIICKHKQFANSPNHVRLLKYLVDKALDKVDINEVTIGSDLYGIDYSIDKNNGTVRSYMYKLRKKLAEYYEEEGRQDAVVFEIEKGQYNMAFLSLQNKKVDKVSDKQYIKISLKTLLISGIVTLVTILGVVIGSELMSRTDYVWTSYFKKDASNLVVISDQFMVNEILPDGGAHGIVYGEINSKNEFIKYAQAHPDKKLNTNDYTLMSKMAPYAVKTLTEWFIANKSDFSLKLESNLTYEDVKANNLIFIGQYKTMNLSKSLFLKNSKVFSTFRDGFKYVKKGKEKVYNTKHGEKGKVEYAMVSFSALAQGKKALYLVSNNDIGVLATVNKFADKEFLKEFYQNLPNSDVSFNALFEVEGIERTDVSCELVELEVVE